MRIAILALLVASASAHLAWEQGSQYEYDVQGRIFVSFVQVANEHTGLVYRAKLHLTPKSDEEVHAQLTEGESIEVQGPLPEDWETKELEGHWQLLEFSKQPFIVRFENGIVTNLEVSKEIPAWEVAVIKSTVGQFQVDNTGKNLIPSEFNTLPRLYKTMEATVDGKCEYLYDVNYLSLREPIRNLPSIELSKDIIEIIKTKNYSNCEQLPVYHFGFPRNMDWEPGTNQMGNFLSRSSISRILLAGSEKKYILQSETTNKIVLSPELYNNQKGQVASQISVTLIASQPVTRALTDLTVPNNPAILKTLVINEYGTRRIISSAQPFSSPSSSLSSSSSEEAATLSSTSTSTNYNPTSTSTSSSSEGEKQEHLEEIMKNPFHSYPSHLDVIASKLVNKVAEVSVNPELMQGHEAGQAFINLVAVVRAMNVQALRRVVRELYVPKNHKDPSSLKWSAWVALRDAIAATGTSSSLLTIQALIREDKILGEEAAQIIATQTNAAQAPTEKYLRTFFELTKEVSNKNQLNTSSLIAFTNLVRLAQVDWKEGQNRYPVLIHGPMAHKDDKLVAEEIIPFLAGGLQKALREGDSVKIQVYTRALGNLAHPGILTVYEPFLEGKEPLTTFQRTLMVVSLNKLATVYPTLARSVLYKIYLNKEEDIPVRVAAVFNLMKADPPASMLQRMAESARHESSIEVRSAIKSAIETSSVLPGEWNAHRRSNAQAAVNILGAEVQGIHYSRYNLTSYLLKGLNLAENKYTAHIGSQDSLLPSGIFNKITENWNGLTFLGQKFGAMSSSAADLQEYIYDLFYEEDHTQDASTVDKIFEQLKVKLQFKKELEGNILAQWAASERFFAFSNASLDRDLKHLLSMMPSLINGQKFSSEKRYFDREISLEFPTATGFPFILMISKPCYLAITGKIQAKKINNEANANEALSGLNYAIEPDLNVRYSTHTAAFFRVIVPMVQRAHVSGYAKYIEVNIPVSAKISIDTDKLKVRAEVFIAENRSNNALLEYNTWPFIAAVSLSDFQPLNEWKENVKVIRVRKPMLLDEVYGGSTLGIALRVRSETDKQVSPLVTLYELIQRHDIISALTLLTSETTVERTMILVQLDSTPTTTSSIEITATYGQKKTNEDNHHQSQHNEAIPEDKQINSEHRRAEFLKKVTTPEARGHVLDMGLKIGGNSPSTFLVTLAGSRHNEGQSHKFLVFAASNTSQYCSFQLAFDAKIAMPNITSLHFMDALKHQEQGQLSAQLNYEYGIVEQTGPSVSVTGHFDRSNARVEYVKNSPQAIQCRNEMSQQNNYLYGCSNATFFARLFDNYRFIVKYNDISKQAISSAYQIYNLIKQEAIPHITENPFARDVAPGYLEIEAQYSPDLSYLNITAATPAGNTIIKNLPIAEVIHSAFVIHPSKSLFECIGFSSMRQFWKPTCSIDGTVAKTFDNVTYPLTSSENWRVVATSLPKMNVDATLDNTKRFAVLLRVGSEGRREVKIIFQDYEDVTVFLSQSSVSVNEQLIDLPENSETVDVESPSKKYVFTLTKLNANTVRVAVSEYDLELIYEPNRLLLTASHKYMSHMGGLCGDFNKEQFDFITPQQSLLRDSERFQDSWTLPENVEKPPTSA